MSTYRTYTPSWSTKGAYSSKDVASSPSSTQQYDSYSRRYGSVGGNLPNSTAASNTTPSYRSNGSSTSSLRNTYATTPARDRSSERVSVRDKYGTYPDRKADGTAGVAGRRSRDPSPSAEVTTTPSFRLYGRSAYSRSTSRDSDSSAASPTHVPASLRFGGGAGTTARFGNSIARSPVSEKPPPVFGVAGDRYSSASSKSDDKTVAKGEEKYSAKSDDRQPYASKIDERPSYKSTTSLDDKPSYRSRTDVKTSYGNSKVEDRPTYGVRTPRSRPEDRSPYYSSGIRNTTEGGNRIGANTTPKLETKETTKIGNENGKDAQADSSSSDSEEEEETDSSSEEESKSPPPTLFMTVVTRGTSPTLPSSSTFLRSRRTDLARQLERTVCKPTKKPATADKAIQSDRGDDTARSSRFAVTSRASPWSSYLDRYSSPIASRYAATSRVGGYSFDSSSSRVNDSASTDSKISSNISKSSSGTDKSVDDSTKSCASRSSSSPTVTTETKAAALTNIAQEASKVSLGGERTTETNEKKVPKCLTETKKETSVAKDKTATGTLLRAQNNSTNSLTSDTNQSNVDSQPNGKTSLTRAPSFKNVTKAIVGKPPVKPETDSTKQKSSSGSSITEKTAPSSRQTTPTPSKEDSNFIRSKSSSNSSVSEQVSLSIDTPAKPVLKSNSNLSKCKSVSNTSISENLSSSGVTSKPPMKLETDKSRNGSSTSLPEKSNSKKFVQDAVSQDEKQNVHKLKSSSGTSLPEKVSTSEKLVNAKLPPAGPKLSSSLHSINKLSAANKDFRKSLLNMDLDAAVTRKLQRKAQRSGSNSSNESDGKLQKGLTGSSSAPKMIESGRKSASRSESSSTDSSSTSSESSDSESSSEDDDKVNRHTISGNKPPLPPGKTEEAKSFLMRALAPVTNLFRSRQDESEKTPHMIRHIESGERAWWMDSNSEVPEGVVRIVSSHNLPGLAKAPSSSGLTKTPSSAGLSRVPSSRCVVDGETGKPPALARAPSNRAIANGAFRIRHQQSGEQAWWLRSNADIPEGVQKLEPSDSSDDDGRESPYDNVPQPKKKPELFIGSHTNIDDILGSVASMVEPAMGVARLRRRQMGISDDDAEAEEIDAANVRIHDSTAKTPMVLRRGAPTDDTTNADGKIKLDDAALQLYKDGDYGAYLDLDASITELQDEFDNFQVNRKNSIVLRTQLSVRVHTIIEKLLNSEGRELRRALFSLKQIFQEDKDLVHEFVQNDGLACLIKVGSEADQNYQNYILRALGQVMLYVDGMNGVMEHNQTVQWLYTLIASKFRLVVKTALKLLLVFVEYVETNCLLLIKAIHAVDTAHGVLPWHNIIKLLKDYDTADTELLIYATTLINKTLNGIPDQDTYYDQVDALEEQGIEAVIQRYMSKQGTDLDLLRQFQIYEAVLHHEDGEEKGTPLKQLDEAIRKTLRQRKVLAESTPSIERRKSRRHSTGTSPFTPQTPRLCNGQFHINNSTLVDDEIEDSSSSRSSPSPGETINGVHRENKNDVGVTPALRRRRERAERQRSFIREQQETAASLKASLIEDNDSENNKNLRLMNGASDGNNINRHIRKDLTPILNVVNKIEPSMSESEIGSRKPWIHPVINGNDGVEVKRENTVKDLTQRLTASQSPVEEMPPRQPDLIGEMTGLVSRAKEGLAKSKSKADVVIKPAPEPAKKSEAELQWEELVLSVKRPLSLADLDFTDLATEDEIDVLSPALVCNGGPPPPPPVPRGAGPPPPPVQRTASSPIRKTKKTVKLFWKEVRDDPIILAKLQKAGMIWDELNAVAVDTQKLEHLFESRAKDLITKKQQEMNKNKEIIVLDHKRSNAINIGMTKLPPPRSIRTAIMKMDATIMNREGIEKLLTMLPTEEECSKIQEAQMANPDLPLGSAEQFLLTLASISELPARLKLWAFKLDYENSEKEVADPLMDLKQGMETLKSNKTFRGILSTLLSIGIFLNGSEVKGFQIEYLAKVPEVKDTVHKHSLLHHLCHIVMEKFPDSSDLYSEIGAITRASKVDFDELAANIQRMEQECKASWEHLKVIAKHDGPAMKAKMSDFLADCAERIIVLGIVHRRVMNRFRKFLLWLGIPLHRVQDLRPNEFCRIVSEFSLEYRTTRERVLQQIEKKASHRERNKTRGKMITEVGKFRSKEDRADAELRQLLGSDISDAESLHGTLTWRRQRKDIGRNTLSREEVVNGHLTDGDDEILESLVKTATKAPGMRTTPRERKRTRNADRKSLKRSRTRENNVMEGCRSSP